MVKKVLLVMILVLISGCKEKIESKQLAEETKKSAQANQVYRSALKLAEDGDPSGLLKLYEISNDDITYTVEYAEVASDSLSYLLYTQTELWIKTFSSINPKQFKWSGINVPYTLPPGVTEDGFEEAIYNKLRSYKGSKSEMDLIDHIFSIQKQKK
jgi:hypothetical protein